MTEPLFRDLLETEFQKRRQVQTHYSVRMFAKDLKLDHSFLAKLLNGSRAITPLTVRRVAPSLGLKPEQVTFYAEELLQEKANVERPSKTRKININVVTPEKFSIISEWYYTAILTAMGLRNFQDTPEWVAAKIGISTHEAVHALHQLEKNGYFRREATGKCVVAEKQNSVLPTKQTTDFLRRYQRQVLSKALTALEVVPLEERDYASVVVATTKTRIEQAKPIIRAFRRKLMMYLEDVDSADELYNLSTTLFPIAHAVKIEETP